MDATDEESVNAIAKHVGRIDGKLDILVNSSSPLFSVPFRSGAD